jgi:hypothetical protein
LAQRSLHQLALQNLDAVSTMHKKLTSLAESRLNRKAAEKRI